ncbi:hypothetical protein [Mariniflexile sp.]|uniref:hypothetical protein n=1 Tax=Mariniflexile sp. TaxID=1979402 RepID=UPI003564D4EB
MASSIFSATITTTLESAESNGFTADLIKDAIISHFSKFKIITSKAASDINNFLLFT